MVFGCGVLIRYADVVRRRSVGGAAVVCGCLLLNWTDTWYIIIIIFILTYTLYTCIELYIDCKSATNIMTLEFNFLFFA